LNTFGRKNLLFFVAVAAVLLAVVSSRYVIYRGSSEMSSTVRAKQTPYSGFRVILIHDTDARNPRILAIEKNREEPTHATLEPSFCRTRTVSGRTLLYIHERPIVPTADLVAYFAEAGDTARRVVLDRKKYSEITQGGPLPPWSDEQLWELCIETAGTK